MSMDQLIEAERDQLLAHWQRVVVSRPCWFEKPFSQVEKLRQADSPQARMLIRHFHDRLGWKAKGALRDGGLCSGAIYRTSEFMRLPQNNRRGTKVGQNVHIEHTVPIGVLHQHLNQQRRGQPLSLDVIYPWLLKYSVVTAFHYRENEALTGWHSRTLCFEPSSDWFSRPFRRYDGLIAEKGEIWDVFNRRKLDSRVQTFAHHMATISGLLKEAGATEQLIRQLF